MTEPIYKNGSGVMFLSSVYWDGIISSDLTVIKIFKSIIVYSYREFVEDKKPESFDFKYLIHSNKNYALIKK